MEVENDWGTNCCWLRSWESKRYIWNPWNHYKTRDGVLNSQNIFSNCSVVCGFKGICQQCITSFLIPVDTERHGNHRSKLGYNSWEEREDFFFQIRLMDCFTWIWGKHETNLSIIEIWYDSFWCSFRSYWLHLFKKRIQREKYHNLCQNSYLGWCVWQYLEAFQTFSHEIPVVYLSWASTSKIVSA